MTELFSLLGVFTLEVLVAFWIIAVARSVLFWLHYVQLKQYRVDRLWHSFKTKSFWKLVFSWYRIVLLVFFILFTVILRGQILPDWAFAPLSFLLFAFLFAYALHTIALAVKHRLQTPVFTKKVWVLFAVLMLIEVGVAYLYLFFVEQILLVEILQPIIVFIVFSVALLPNLVLQQQAKRKAKAKRKQFSGLKVVGITGSYGKTTTKEFLAHILSSKYSVLKTPEHVNVDTGVAKQVLSELSSDHEVYVVEMGAYKRGEIKSICDIVLPTHAIMTGLGNQHLELFGSLENIEKGKFELVDAVAEKENIAANADSDRLIQAFKKRKIKPMWYSEEEKSFLQAENVSFSDSGIHFTIDGVYFKASVFGKAMLVNLLGAITMAKHLGLSLQEISESLKTVASMGDTMTLLQGPKKSIFIDDSYNANSTGVMAAISDMALSGKTKKVLVFKEVIELGENDQFDHEKIGGLIAQQVDYVYLLDSPHKSLMMTVLKNFGFNMDRVLHQDEIRRLRDLIDHDTAVLFEGAGTKTIMKQLL